MDTVGPLARLRHGALAKRHVREFDEKWLRGGAPAGEPLVGITLLPVAPLLLTMVSPEELVTRLLQIML